MQFKKLIPPHLNKFEKAVVHGKLVKIVQEHFGRLEDAQQLFVGATHKLESIEKRRTLQIIAMYLRSA